MIVNEDLCLTCDLWENKLSHALARNRREEFNQLSKKIFENKARPFCCENMCEVTKCFDDIQNWIDFSNEMYFSLLTTLSAAKTIRSASFPSPAVNTCIILYINSFTTFIYLHTFNKILAHIVYIQVFQYDKSITIWMPYLLSHSSLSLRITIF